MIQATTPTLTLTIPNTFDLSTAQLVLVSFSQYETTLTKELGDSMWLMESNVIAVTLSQEETLMFIPRKQVEVQVNWITENGARCATNRGALSFGKNLIPEVISA